jgi:hypothetical protein
MTATREMAIVMIVAVRIALLLRRFRTAWRMFAGATGVPVSMTVREVASTGEGWGCGATAVSSAPANADEPLVMRTVEPGAPPSSETFERILSADAERMFL